MRKTCGVRVDICGGAVSRYEGGKGKAAYAKQRMRKSMRQYAAGARECLPSAGLGSADQGSTAGARECLPSAGLGGADQGSTAWGFPSACVQ